MEHLLDKKTNRDNLVSRSNLQIPEKNTLEDSDSFPINQDGNGDTLDTLRGPYPNNIIINTDEFITSTNLNEKLPDNMHNFLISLCKCLELTDEGCSACLIDNKIIVTFNGIDANSEETNIHMKSVLKFIELILNKNFKNEKDFEDLYDHLCSIRDHSLSRNHHKCYQINKFLNQYTALLKHFKWIKSNHPDSFNEDLRVKLALEKFAVSFNRVISSKFLEKIRNGTYRIEIAGSGEEKRHAEIRLARYLMKRYHNDRNKIKGLFIATSKRPCFACHKILQENLVMEPYSLSFYSRESSNKRLEDYGEYWPKFLVDKSGNAISYQDFEQKCSQVEHQPGSNDTSIQFVFDEIDDPDPEDELIITIDCSKLINRGNL